MNAVETGNSARFHASKNAFVKCIVQNVINNNNNDDDDDAHDDNNKMSMMIMMMMNI